jgi:hypothetical protein
MPISKPFAVATEGQTIDGRNIDRKWIEDMAKYYDPKVYTAVINLEHYLSAVPDSIFSALGKVMSLSTQKANILGDEKMQLMAVVDVPEEVVALQKKGKKAFASIEPKQNFLGKGISYLTGLALTDTPASVGTESMKFSTLNMPDVYSFDTELKIEWENTETNPSSGENLFSKVKSLLNFKAKNDEARFADIGQAVEAIAVSQKELIDNFSAAETELSAAQKTIDELKAQAEKYRAEFASFKALVDKMPDGTIQRPTASGGKDEIKTDC